jgi:hypothetical protein
MMYVKDMKKKDFKEALKIQAARIQMLEQAARRLTDLVDEW